MRAGSETDLSQLSIDRAARPRRRWIPLALLLGLALVAAAVYPSARAFVEERRAPEVDVARASRAAAAPDGGAADLPVLVATGYVIARRSSDVGVKVGGRLASIAFEEGTRVGKGRVIAQIEHADIEAQLEAARRAV